MSSREGDTLSGGRGSCHLSDSREAQGLSQEALGGASQLGRSRIDQIERGVRPGVRHVTRPTDGQHLKGDALSSYTVLTATMEG
ncbi:helix-turn-helix transcriptional regulator [Streptomyces sp. NPDC048420]|uniref:helix-turn-helix domain-containing protein n=1 Tax=Streptomyces sp. NPDC048420 TaxID=3155755 RepID=UPI0034268738